MKPGEEATTPSRLEQLAAGIRGSMDAWPALRYLALGITWLLLWRMSALMQIAPHASIWFPPAGLTFAALLVLGWRAIPVLMLCSVAVTFWVDLMYQSHTPWRDLLFSGLLFGIAHCLAYGGGAELLRRIIRRSAVHSVSGIIIAFLVIGCLSALCAALAGTQVLEWTGMLARTAGTSAPWLPWWIGDLAGVLVFAPLFLALLSLGFPEIESWFGGLNFQPLAPEHGGYAGKLAVSVGLLSVVMLVAAHFRYPEIGFAVFFLIIPQMWIVYTETAFRSAVSLALFSTVLVLWVAALGLVEQALAYQFAICVIAASAYFGLAVPVLVASNKQLTELAFNDGLTKAATKARFFEEAARELADARRYGQPVSLIVLDIDHFKQINDHFGHAAGDQALIRLAREIRSRLRQSDILGRFGGDEFMLLLPGIGLEQARETTTRLRELLARTAVPGTDRMLSASFGVVCIEAGETVHQAFKRADHLLLEAKRARRSVASRMQPDSSAT